MCTCSVLTRSRPLRRYNQPPTPGAGTLHRAPSAALQVTRTFNIPTMNVSVRVVEARAEDGVGQYAVEVRVVSPDGTWVLRKRYSQFMKLHERVGELANGLDHLFPPKVLWGSSSPDTMDERKVKVRRVACHHTLPWRLGAGVMPAACPVPRWGCCSPPRLPRV